MEENNNIVNENNNKKSNANWTLLIVIIIILILLGIAGYFLFIKKSNGKEEPQKQEEKININYDILNYQFISDYDSEDCTNIQQLLKTDDEVQSLYAGKDYKIHVVLLKSVTKGNNYLYMVDEDKYYFKDDNYNQVSLIYEGFEKVGERNIFIYDYSYAMVYQMISNQHKTYNTKVYSFKTKKYVAEFDEYIHANDISCDEYENTRYYKIGGKDKSILYDKDFNIIIEGASSFALDDKYIYGEIKEYSNVEPDIWTYNYYAKDKNGEYEIYDFEGNLLFKTDEKTYLKSVKTSEYTLPVIPELHYSKKENKIKFLISSVVCGDESCPGQFLDSYYEYDIESKKTMHKFFVDIVPDDVYQNLINGYIELK